VVVVVVVVMMITKSVPLSTASKRTELKKKSYGWRMHFDAGSKISAKHIVAIQRRIRPPGEHVHCAIAAQTRGRIHLSLRALWLIWALGQLAPVPPTQHTCAREISSVYVCPFLLGM